MRANEFSEQTFSAPEDRCSALATIVLQQLDSSWALRVLDLGCGTGELLLALARALPEADFTGVDISAANIDLARRRCAALALDDRISFHAVDYMKLRTPPFDLIVSDSTLHLMTTSTGALFSKIHQDLRPGGSLINNMPYDCRYNQALWALRRVLRAVRSPLSDACILAAGKLLHGGELSSELLRQRVHYMYLLPRRYDGPALRQLLAGAFAMELEGEYPVPHASLAQPLHRITVFRQRG